jgi:hypothetical protein
MPGSGMGTIWKMGSEDDSWKIPECVPIGVDGRPEAEARRADLARSTACLPVLRGNVSHPAKVQDGD